MNHPNFFILGAQKTATTYLATVLLKHPDVLFSNPKEVFFFDKKNISTEDYMKYCSKYYKGAAKRIGEGTTTYLQAPYAPANVMRYVPQNPLFIVCLRHPLEKAISFFIHNWRRNRYPADISILTAGFSNKQFSPYYTSIYSNGIKKWLDTSGGQKKQFLFLQQEELKENRQLFIHKATSFLGISESVFQPTNIYNRGLPYILNQLEGTLIFKDSQNMDNSIVIKLSELEELHSTLSEQTRQVEDLTGLNLSHWLTFPYHY